MLLNTYYTKHKCYLTHIASSTTMLLNTCSTWNKKHPTHCKIIDSHPTCVPHCLHCSFSFSHLVQLQVQSYAHFGHHLCSDLRTSDASATRLCQSSVHTHVVLLPEAPCQARGKRGRSQCAMQKCMQLRNGCKELCTILFIALMKRPVQLSHTKAPFLQGHVVCLWKSYLIFIAFDELLNRDIQFEPSANLLVLVVGAVHVV